MPPTVSLSKKGQVVTPIGVGREPPTVSLSKKGQVAGALRSKKGQIVSLAQQEGASSYPYRGR